MTKKIIKTVAEKCDEMIKDPSWVLVDKENDGRDYFYAKVEGDDLVVLATDFNEAGLCTYAGMRPDNMIQGQPASYDFFVWAERTFEDLDSESYTDWLDNDANDEFWFPKYAKYVYETNEPTEIKKIKPDCRAIGFAEQMRDEFEQNKLDEEAFLLFLHKVFNTEGTVTDLYIMRSMTSYWLKGFCDQTKYNGEANNVYVYVNYNRFKRVVELLKEEGFKVFEYNDRDRVHVSLY